MTRPLDPEIKGLRAMHRGFGLLPENARHRALEWLVNWYLGRSDFRLPYPARCHRG